MKSKESQVAAQIRLNQWALEVQECINFPKDMTVDEWCEQHNIKKANYYWRLKRVRQACLEQLETKRLQQRQLVVKPLVDALFVYLKNTSQDVSAKNKLGEAYSYMLNQEKYLRVFLADGEVPIDNNASERAIKGFCIGKKNWQIIDTISGAKSSAIIYSIAETAKANNLKPYEYFEYLLSVIPEHMEDTDTSFLEELLPWSEALPENIRKPNR